MIGAEAGSRTRTTLLTTDFKSVARVLTSFYYARPSSIYRCFSRQSKLRLAWYEHVSPSSSPHLCAHKSPHLRLILELMCTNMPFLPPVVSIPTPGLVSLQKWQHLRVLCKNEPTKRGQFHSSIPIGNITTS